MRIRWRGRSRRPWDAAGGSGSQAPIWAAALVGALLAGLFLTGLRVDSIRLRYRLAQALGQERSLAERRRELAAEVRRLRDPLRLTKMAEKRGFVRPARVIELPPAPARDDAFR